MSSAGYETHGHVTISFKLSKDDPSSILVLKGSADQCMRLIEQEAPALIERITAAAAAFNATRRDEDDTRSAP